MVRHLFLSSLKLMATVWFSGNSKLSFAITDCISQGSLAENRIYSSWFKQRKIYYRVLNGLQNLLGRWRNRLEVEFSGTTSRASQKSRPPREQCRPVLSGCCLPTGGCFRTMLPLVWEGRKVPQKTQTLPVRVPAGRSSRSMAPNLQIFAFQIWLHFVWLMAPGPHSCKVVWKVYFLYLSSLCSTGRWRRRVGPSCLVIGSYLRISYSGIQVYLHLVPQVWRVWRHVSPVPLFLSLNACLYTYMW